MEPSAQIKMCAQTVAQFFFHENKNVKCPLIFNWPIIWTTIISASFMYSKRLKLRTTDVEILHQSLIKGLS